ncbi:MAG TPA: glycosyltransferase family 4 protein [Candidatus Binatia bacterium]|nr:glycosyltransferase family 4 protein [Candidatus Binatia bacterium]
MRILLVNDWNRGRGGAEAYTLWIRDRLRAAGDEVALLTGGAGSAADGSAEFVAYAGERRAEQALLQIANPFAIAAVRRAVRALQPDVAWVNMFAHQLSPAAVHALGAVPFVLAVSDYKAICPVGSKLLPDGSPCGVRAGWACRRAGCVGLAHWLRDRPRYALIAAAVRRARRVLACSAWVQRALAGEGIASEVLHLPVPRPVPSFRRAPSDDPSLLYCGRLDVEKGVALLVCAFAALAPDVPRARLRIAGAGPERAELERLARDLGVGDRVAFLGWVGPDALDAELRSAWGLVVPSLWAEPFGLVAAEAIVRGVPVVASADGGLGEIVEPGASGLLFPNGDERALTRRLAAIARREAFPDRVLGVGVVRTTAERFDLDRHVADLRRILAEAAQPTRVGGRGNSSFA